MNERIRELYLQAGGEVDMSGAYFMRNKESTYKFAELIVRECISACATDNLGKTVGVEELIKQHFGVES